MQENRGASRWRGHALAVGLALGTLGVLAQACGGLGVEQYRTTAPRATLAVRRVAAEGRADAERLPRLDGEGEVALEPGAVLRASHVAEVQLVTGADGARLLVLQLRDEGRVRLREATASDEGQSVSRVDRRLALVADDRVIATPTVRGVLDQNEIAIALDDAQVDAAFAALSP
jgi:preprotein translocase subunit SecD